jgi:hypothetical protein
VKPVRTIGVAIAALAFALTSSAIWQPASAGPACNELDLDSPCVVGSDLRANLVVGGATGDARLRLRDGGNANGFDLRATTGNVTNRFSNDENESNGLVKAWAQIEADGTVVACWRCNADPEETRRLGTGLYEVDFTPLDTDLRGRPRTATIDVHIGLSLADAAFVEGSATLADRVVDASSILIITFNQGTLADRSFVLAIY